ncbi:MAG: tetratricopeptide repeat protein [Alphaproteobacteria bacterium]|nr:tetratricopeptide repeat protein [Alphaproteobacteria bacterium]
MSAQAIAQAVQLLQGGAFEQARGILSDVVARDPDNADALNLLGIALAQAQNFPAAVDAMQRAIAAAPQHSGAHMNFGGVLKRIGRLGEAAVAFDNAAALRPDAPVPALRQLASVLIDLGRGEEAAACCTRILALVPQDAIALNDRGLAQLDLGRAEAAMADFDAAVGVNPRFAAALGNRGLALMQLGRTDDALAACDTALALEPQNPGLHRTKAHVLLAADRPADAFAAIDSAIALGLQDATTWTLRGEALKRAGRNMEALANFHQALQADPAHWDALIAAGMVCLESDKFTEAADAFSRAANARPNEALAYYGRARAARGLNNLQAALYDADRAVDIAPDDTDVLALRMQVKRELGRRAEALADCERALALKPSSLLYANKGVLLEELQRPEEALGYYERAFELDARNWIALQNLGGALVQLGRGEEALAACEAKLAASPGNSELLIVKGMILLVLGRFDEAVAALDGAIAGQLEDSCAHFYKGLTLLTQGKLAEGFAEYEWRRRGPAPLLKLMKFDQPEPLSADDVCGKRLTLYREQGLGDMIQYARFARAFADRGAKVTLVTYPALARLLPSLGPDIDIATDDMRPEADFAFPLMSAPYLLQTTLETIPAQVPYLAAPGELAAAWRERLGAKTGLRVGLTWSGSQSHVSDWARSMPFEQLRSVLGVSGATYRSVQKDVRPDDDAALAASGVCDWRGQLTDLAETAALISELDLVITVDTSVAHLAGALGKPVWILLATRVDWRWLAEGPASPWYPSARLFRQNTPGTWGTVLSEVRAALEELASGQ